MTDVLVVFCLATAAMSLVMTAAWLTQRALDDGGWVDVFWTFGTGLVVAAAAILPLHAEPGVPWRRWLAALLVVTWSLRLGGYIAVRVARGGAEDPRYAGFRREWGQQFQRRMFGLVIVQAPVTGLLALSVAMAAHAPAAALRPQDFAAVAVFVAAIAGEALADDQLRRFRADAANKGKVCEFGLWGWSRHPNYFFEAAVWLTWPVMGFDAGRPWTWTTLIAPLLMYLLVRFVSGVPPLETAMMASRGAAYADYQRRVSVLVPRPPSH